ncbi:MAG TPA: sulfur carrier protein ThiS [Thiolapillus brandeum]|uniref:Sulfur carrier protein ThiS n=1 Tax=Thiolapillus brandeum TaxID=1076588 RepID=A0A831RUG0_9GAMM|nr:sulfur carrier protein ThiS [Thiolapillus brandeum]
MNISVNGEKTRVDDNLTLAALIDGMTLEGTRYAVEVNEELIPRSQHAEHLLHEGDAVEIVQAIGGG